MLYTLGKSLIWLIAHLFGRVRIIGREHIPLSGGVMVAANHTSYIDPPLVGLSLHPRHVSFMAKSELFTPRVMGYLLPRVGAFPVRRGTADRQALRHAHALLTSGHAVAIFFEGTRSPDGKLQPPELGPAMIALRAGVPVLPVALIDADKMLPREGGLHFARVTVVIGAPLTFSHLAGQHNDRDALREVGETIARAVADLLRAHGAADRIPPDYLAHATE